MLRVVCAVVENAAGELLLCQRAMGAAQAGLWEFPGGKIEGHESPARALVREIQEELGCAIAVAESLTPVEYHYPSLSIKLLPYRCEILDGEPQALEHQALAWVPLERLREYDWAPADEPIIDELEVLKLGHSAEK